MSCAHWLSWACGIDAHTAREKVRVARALEDLPLLSEALSKGELGYSKVRALTRVATPGNEANLLEIGLHGTAAHVEKFARLYRQATQANETERTDARQRERGLTFWHEDDGTVVLHGRFPPEMAARILGALEAAMDAHAAEQPAAVRSQEHTRGSPPDVPTWGRRPPKPPVTVRRADALAWMADRAFESGDAPAPFPPTGMRSWSTWTPRCSPAPGPGGAKSRVTRLLQGRRRGVCAAMRESSLPSMARTASRSPWGVAPAPFPPAMRRALLIRDRGCRFPGCASTRRLHGHHVRHWARGGDTSLDNLILLCPFHHRLVHEGGFDVHRLDDGAYRFVSPQGWTVRPPRTPGGSSPEDIVRQNEARGVVIDGRTATARWDGQPVDYDQAVMVAMASWEARDYRPRTDVAAANGSPP